MQKRMVTALNAVLKSKDSDHAELPFTALFNYKAS
jgi:hypothetical protein